VATGAAFSATNRRRYRTEPPSTSNSESMTLRNLVATLIETDLNPFQTLGAGIFIDALSFQER